VWLVEQPEPLLEAGAFLPEEAAFLLELVRVQADSMAFLLGLVQVVEDSMVGALRVLSVCPEALPERTVGWRAFPLGAAQAPVGKISLVVRLRQEARLSRRAQRGLRVEYSLARAE
jgi:hypothetical protein